MNTQQKQSQDGGMDPKKPVHDKENSGEVKKDPSPAQDKPKEVEFPKQPGKDFKVK